MNDTMKKAIAELVGTFVLVFFACGTAIVTSGNVVATALSFGLAIIVVAFSIGRISGCHINPAVSFAMLMSKRMSVKEFIYYIIAQFLGGLIAASILFSIVQGSGFGLVRYATNNVITTSAGGYITSILLEIILTFVFVYTVLCVTSKKDNSKNGALIIGLALTLVHLLGINLTGTSVNPARSFGPAIMRIFFKGGASSIIQFWVFLVAPAIGGFLAALLFKFFASSTNDERVIEARETTQQNTHSQEKSSSTKSEKSKKPDEMQQINV